MSQENVDIVRQAWEAYRRRDNEAALALYDPEIEFELRSEGRIDAGDYHGLEGVQEFFRNWDERFR